MLLSGQPNWFDKAVELVICGGRVYWDLVSLTVEFGSLRYVGYGSQVDDVWGFYTENGPNLDPLFSAIFIFK